MLQTVRNSRISLIANVELGLWMVHLPLER